MIAKTVLTRWRANPINFIQQVLINPETNRPFVLLDAERAFLTYAFTLGADGRLPYPEQVYACPKKSGKRRLPRSMSSRWCCCTVELIRKPSARPTTTINPLGASSLQSKELLNALRSCAHEAKITVDKIIIFGAVIIAIPGQLCQRRRQQSCHRGF